MDTTKPEIIEIVQLASNGPDEELLKFWETALYGCSDRADIQQTMEMYKAFPTKKTISALV